VLEWILGPLNSGEVEAIVFEGDRGPEYASVVPGTDVQVFWLMEGGRGRTQVYYIEFLPP
ncbi:MAG: hypothetical protein ACXVQY_01790, partial [Actinomycetota bacterium]